jgi:hypothetical protein
VPLHGAQELGAFHDYYDHHCYLPPYVFFGQAMLATRFIVRADSGFCHCRLLQWRERLGVGYIIWLACNARLHAAMEVAEAALAHAHKTSSTKQRLICEFSYATQCWPQRAIARPRELIQCGADEACD